MVLVETLAPAQTLAWLNESAADAAKIETGELIKPRVFMDLSVDGLPSGRVVVELDTENAPVTCANYLALCTGSHKDKLDKRLHYKGTSFHRIVPSMYLCGGDVINDNGTSGMSIYGETFRDEKTGIKHDAPGILSMLGHGPNTNNSQFFISLTPAPWMDEFYVGFGKVISGLDVLQKLSENYGTESGVPSSDNVRIGACGQL